MVKISSLLALGRKMGLENVSSLNTFKKAMADGFRKPVDIKFKLNPKLSDEVSALLGEKGNIPGLMTPNELIALSRRYAPKAFADGVEALTHVKVKRFSDKSFATSVTCRASNGSAYGNTKLLHNEAGVRIKANGFSEVSTYNADVTYIRGSENPGIALLNRVKVNTEYIDPTTGKKMTQVSLPTLEKGSVRGSFDYQINSEYLNRLISRSTKGECFDAQDLINTASKKLAGLA